MTMKREAGFTLLEILVAVTITSLLLFTVYGVFTSVSTAKQRLEAGGESQHQARILLDRLGREVHSTYFKQSDPRCRFLGGVDDEGIPFLELTTTAVTPHGGNKAGLAILRYELRPDEETGEGKKVLMRQEYPVFTQAGSLPPAYRMATVFEDLRFRFHDGNQWQDQWNANPGGVPGMLEVSVTVLRDGRPEVFTTAFQVPRI